MGRWACPLPAYSPFTHLPIYHLPITYSPTHPVTDSKKEPRSEGKTRGLGREEGILTGDWFYDCERYFVPLTITVPFVSAVNASIGAYATPSRTLIAVRNESLR